MNSDEVFNMLTGMADIGSFKTKQSLLKMYDCPLLLKVLKYAYDPSMKFNLNNPQYTYTREGANKFNDNTFRILDQLNTRQLSGKKAKIIIGSLLQGFTYKSRELFLRILNKDLRCGISIKTINKAFPDLIYHFEVMLAKEFDENHARFPCYVQPKVDGIRGILKEGKFYSRFGNQFKGLEHLEFKCPMPLDGELFIHGMSFERMSGLIRNFLPTPEAIFIVFDYIEEGVPYINRIKMLQHAASQRISIIPIRTEIAYSPLDIECYYNSYIHQGYEGAMIKSIDHLYQHKRSWDWMKMKKRETTEVEVVDMLLGEGKFQKVMGYLVCVYKEKEIRVGSGFSDAQREEFTYNPPLGETIEVFYQEETADGVLRHPVFKCIKGM